jgi:uncharacterized protein YndB with AHSA1/START domain
VADEEEVDPLLKVGGRMAANLVARASTTIDAPPDAVWQALVTPPAIKQYMFGADVASTWRKGAAINVEGGVAGYLER